MKCYYAPQYINQNNILWWEKDEIRFVFAPFIIFGLIMGFFVLGIVGSFVVGYSITKLRKHKPEGYIKHLQYFNLPYNPKPTGIKALFVRSKSFPDSSIRHITG